MDQSFYQRFACRARQHRSTAAHHRKHPLLIAMFCAVCIFQFATESRAQCSARDVLQKQLKLKPASSAHAPVTPIRSVVDPPAWKKITLGNFSNSLTLRNALDANGCHVGGSAEEVLARPAFIVSSRKKNVELVTVSAAELGFKTDTVTLASIYARAKRLGFGIAPAEIGPQLRLQYLDQPTGEFLIIGMDSIKTWSGEEIILTVANGGAGLILIGQDGSADAAISATSRLVFERPTEAAPVDQLERAAAFLPP
ncbi:hypothetical protein AXW67_34260 [Bradyrhizobium neotropicale]|uniref:Uncharacterized protein n=2 Tax=Bradyrhizobium neotropicale TaxID=1497615 RepID=A0A176ZJL2_9BRAD|nr:hypothetical protein [Bradyrhizobium neotropicale]OAF20005.1 hypothetical protein AXW67_34260 [Bradyrhizobium neotropicale]